MWQTEKKTTIVFHFNKKHLVDPLVPMWVVKCRGQTHYVRHVDFDVGKFSTKETPDNPHTKGSLKFKGHLFISDEIALITGEKK